MRNVLFKIWQILKDILYAILGVFGEAFITILFYIILVILFCAVLVLLSLLKDYITNLLSKKK